MPNREFHLKTSRLHLCCALVLWSVSMLVVYMLPFTDLVKLIDVVLVSVYCLYIVRPTFSSITCLGAGKWLLKNARGEYAAELAGDSVTTEWASVLRFRAEKHRKLVTCIIFCDSLSSEQYRNLMITLRVERDADLNS